MVDAAAPQERPSVLIPLQIWFLVLCVSGLFMLLEIPWVLFLLWLPWFVGTRWNVRAGALVGILSSLVLVAHFYGYKAAGSPRVVDNRPFEPDAYIAVLGPGTTLTLSDGRSFNLAGLTEKTLTDGRGALGPSWRIAGRDRRSRHLDAAMKGRGLASDDACWPIVDERLRLWEKADGIPAQIIDEGDGRARVVVGVTNNYWCGNTFFPTLFPQRLPRFGTMDFGLFLLMRTNAVALDGTGKDPDYQMQLDAAYWRIQQRAAETEAERVRNEVETERVRKLANDRAAHPPKQ